MVVTRIALQEPVLVNAINQSGGDARLFNYNRGQTAMTASLQVWDADLAVLEQELESDRIIGDWMQVSPAMPQPAEYVVTFPKSEWEYLEGFDNIVDRNGILHQSIFRDDSWHMQIVFEQRDDVRGYRNDLEDLGFGVELQQVSENRRPSVETTLTKGQREILQHAVDRGYFHVPRDANLSELADGLDISTEAASERLRRGLNNLVSSVMSNDATAQQITFDRD